LFGVRTRALAPPPLSDRRPRPRRGRAARGGGAPPAAGRPAPPGRGPLGLGAGGLGQFGIQFPRLLTDAAVDVGDPSPQKRERALELGAEEAAAPEDLEGPYTAVLDFVGSKDSLAQAVSLVDLTGIA